MADGRLRLGRDGDDAAAVRGPRGVVAGEVQLRIENATRDRKRPAIVDLLTMPSPITEELRILRAKIRVLDQQNPCRCFGLVSAAGGEGKTTVSLGLTMALAQEADQRVLLLEVDLRRPSVERYLGLAPAEGLGDFLRASSDEVLLRRVEPHGFLLLSAGLGPSPAPELLGSERMHGLLAALRRKFDWIVVDCPPVGPVADTVLLQDLLDGFLFVVRARRSPIETISKALSHLRAGAVRGVVFNDNREILTSYYTYGYHSYHDRY